jgi:membrane protein
MLIIGPLLVGGFLGLTHAALQSEPVQLLQGVPPLRRGLQAALRLSPYVMVTALFTVLYVLIPNTRVRLRPALIGGVCAGVAWAAIGKMFTTMVVSSTRLLIVYAGFAVIVAVLTWTYFGWLILLAGTRLSFYVQNPSYLRLGLTALELSGIEREQLALRLMFFVGKAELSGAGPPSIDALAAQLAVPGMAVAQSAAALERAGLLAVNDRDELLPGRAVDRIALYEILAVARTEGSGHQVGPAAPVPAVERLGVHLERGWRECCGTRTLRSLIEEA